MVLTIIIYGGEQPARAAATGPRPKPLGAVAFLRKIVNPPLLAR